MQNAAGLQLSQTVCSCHSCQCLV